MQFRLGKLGVLALLFLVGNLALSTGAMAWTEATLITNPEAVDATGVNNDWSDASSGLGSLPSNGIGMIAADIPDPGDTDWYNLGAQSSGSNEFLKITVTSKTAS